MSREKTSRSIMLAILTIIIFSIGGFSIYTVNKNDQEQEQKALARQEVFHHDYVLKGIDENGNKYYGPRGNTANGPFTVINTPTEDYPQTEGQTPQALTDLANAPDFQSDVQDIQEVFPQSLRATDVIKDDHPMLGMSITDEDGHEIIDYFDTVNFPADQVKVINGTTLEVVSKDDKHGFYIKLEGVYTNPKQDWQAKEYLETYLKEHCNKVYMQVRQTFPDGNRVANVFFVKDEDIEDSGAEKYFFDMNASLRKLTDAVKTQEDADKDFADLIQRAKDEQSRNGITAR